MRREGQSRITPAVMRRAEAFVIFNTNEEDSGPASPRLPSALRAGAASRTAFRRTRATAPDTGNRNRGKGSRAHATEGNAARSDFDDAAHRHCQRAGDQLHRTRGHDGLEG